METRWWMCRNCGVRFASPTYQPECGVCAGYPDVGADAWATLLALAITLGAMCWVFWGCQSSRLEFADPSNQVVATSRVQCDYETMKTGQHKVICDLPKWNNNHFYCATVINNQLWCRDEP